MKFILGKKQNMSQIFDNDGRVIPVTVISAGPIVVTQVKNEEKDGYGAVQFGFGQKKPKNIAKPQLGHFKNLGNFGFVREYRLAGKEEPKLAVGEKVDVSAFSVGDRVSVAALSKGKGFQGVVKRHGFHGGPRTHGQKHSEREPGSIGGGLRSRVPKGMRMAGRMGGDRITVKNLEVAAIDQENNLLMITGAVPGRRGTLVEVRAS
ncbi:MAG: 50S ribosomal protein L3 [Candidatus Zambryskibacteria bacterium RIFCSPHIGHO2_01_FULL_43_25]|uniref:Large ribosomal subunit protein uL3 n=1 Tax=Candidatus Zambryskibacteria bacterium RIFCSPLOWO2_01_FULL_45_21 TaxID=1802761 RepID=A0A1G2U4I4_9BACT|nr:MAG: 50S ribosomal protein L3 [Candidatus Zambryskibacteria bacterium RIFCSPHIGHO2_01_FULL_43_25]OHB00820.1 MAG: 50S ribosomal protein L3 [Candidatus Zambryskibacteria bacterium RIFCSPHIGHO2_12_FULL_44_12b]OHB04415.1 MAG: 50S ribosomal protein L3 [Candidatus Zambryskibacteria bacterium RIFCSPLOWO2_01_FULL_45_21]